MRKNLLGKGNGTFELNKQIFFRVLNIGKGHKTIKVIYETCFCKSVHEQWSCISKTLKQILLSDLELGDTLYFYMILTSPENVDALCELPPRPNHMLQQAVNDESKSRFSVQTDWGDNSQFALSHQVQGFPTLIGLLIETLIIHPSYLAPTP